MIVLGIDPGARFTGVALVDGTPSPLGCRDAKLLAHAVIEAGGDESEYFAAVGLGLVEIMLDQGVTNLGLVALEDVVAPSPHVRRKDGNSIIRPGTLIETAKVYGYVARWAAWADVELVPIAPAGNGSQHLGTYPDELVAPGERRLKDWRFRLAGKSNPINHARSAWDVALAALIRL